jgi:hypothetical protein
MYQTDEVRNTLISLGSDELKDRRDLPSLQYVAESLRNFSRDRSIIQLLERIIQDPDIDPVTRRRAHEALYEQDGRALPEQTEEEILYGLVLQDARGNYSDWKVVRDYAEYVYERAAKGRRSFSPAVCQALKDCLRHAHTFVGEPAVHGIVLTSDDHVLLAKRSARAHYAPAHWSVSFEEQLNEHDLNQDADPFTNAACRGFREEFGGDLPPGQVVALSAVLQLDLLNVAMVMLLQPDLTAAQIQESWRSGPPDSWEAQELQSLPIRHLDRLSRGDANPFMPLHTTSRLRSSLLQRWIAANRPLA